MTKDDLMEGMQQFGFGSIAAFDTAVLTFNGELRDICASNACGRYNACWSCPPAVGSYDELVELCNSYSNGLLMSSVYDIEDPFDFEGMMRTGNEFCEMLVEAEGWLRSCYGRPLKRDLSVEEWPLAYEHYQLFGTGSCNDCKKCTYPDNPCLFPDRLFIPIESCGILVSALAKEVGMKYIAGPDTVTYFGMLLHN